MRRFGRHGVLTYVIVGFMIIGLLYSIGTSFSRWIVPVAVFGLVFLLYRYPPSTWRYWAQRFRSGGFGGFGKGDKTFGKKTKKAKFTVIRGSKPDDDEPPKYH